MPDPAARALLDRLHDGPVPAETVDEAALSRLQAAGVETRRDEDTVVLVGLPEYGWPAVAAGLAAPYDVELHDTLPSTNDRARELAVAGRAGVAVLAVEQTAGRGRRDRTWSSPPGGVWCSLALRPTVPPARRGVLPLVGAVAVTRSARELGVPATIKWPNDVLVGGRKLAGVLTESGRTADGDEPWLVLGMGVNADVPASALPPDATSLRQETGDQVDRAAVARAVLEAVATLADDPDGALAAWRALADTLGREVRVETDTGTVTGRATAVTETGALVVATGDGERTVTAGDCEHLRPAAGDDGSGTDT